MSRPDPSAKYQLRAVSAAHQARRSATRLIAGGAAACLALAVVLALLLQVALPGWYLVPGTILSVTGQQVPSSPSGQVAAAAQSLAAAGASAVGAAPKAAGAPLQSAGQSTQSLLPSRRFNVLLLGSDNDLKFPASAVLTQSMILVSIDPSTRQVAMVSIPRDFWVPIAGVGYQKIDAAYEVGGIALARSTVERLFGVHIDYYAWVGLTGLVKIIDTLGGVDVTVLHPVLDEMYPDDLNTQDPYAYFRLYIPSGPQHLDGTTALEYVRSRHGDLQSDFGRSARQQQVLLAIKSLMENPAMLSRMPTLVNSLEGSVKTDFNVPALAQLAVMGRSLTRSDIHQEVLSAPQFASLGNSPDGTEQVVFPNWSAIRPEVARLLDLRAPSISQQLAEQVRSGSTPVQVLNGTTQPGLAEQLTTYLAWQGFTTGTPANARRASYPTSEVIANGGTTPAAEALASLLSVPITPGTATARPSVTVVIGASHPAFPNPYAG